LLGAKIAEQARSEPAKMGGKGYAKISGKTTKPPLVHQKLLYFFCDFFFWFFFWFFWFFFCAYVQVF